MLLSDVDFWIVGDCYLRPDLERLSSSLGLNSNLSFLHQQDNVRELLLKMTIGVICSDSEGLSNSIMEYMASGLPVVATKTGGNPELIEDGKTGFMVRPGDSEALAAALIYCIQQNELALTMGLTAREWIRSAFSIEKMLISASELYESSLKK